MMAVFAASHKDLIGMHQLPRICLLILLMFSGINNVLAQQKTIDAEPVKAKYLSKEYHALVVGISNYASWPVLPNAVQDARDISRLLTHNGFTVTLLTDPTSLELKGALNDLVYTTGQEEDRSLLFYFAGHGETRIMLDGRAQGWIVPIDCPLMRIDPQGFQKKAVSTRAIETFSLQIRSKQVLMLFDCSFSGEEFDLAIPSIKPIGKRSANPIRQYIIAGRADEPVPDRSMFKKYVIQGLLGDANVIYDDYITGSELGHFLSQWVERSTKSIQHPQYAKIRKAELAAGDFIMMKLKAIPKPKQAHLYVEAQPRNSSVRILNIVPKFRQGIALKSGKYLIEVSADNYRTSKQWITLKAGQEKRLKVVLSKDAATYTNFLGMHFVKIKPGTFNMGSPQGQGYGGNDEKLHRVDISRPYFLLTSEVTIGQFKKFVAATDYQTEADRSTACWIGTQQGRWKKQHGGNWRDPNPSDEKTLTDAHPVACVTWNDARAFIEWLEKMDGRVYMLPSEAQWEYACRAGSKTAFAFGRCLSTDQGNFGALGPYFSQCKAHFKQARKGLIRVTTLEPNKWGLFDMHGNVTEWCRDWYDAYPDGPVKDPIGPPSGSERVMRGGHFFSEAHDCRSARRVGFPPGFAAEAVGFRVVMEP
jgi:formylglycine-generating enzyme required for sulfatase activity